MSTTIKLLWATCNRQPAGCPACGAARIEFTTTQPFDGWPSWGWCPSCSHSWEDVLITTAVVREIRATSSGRTKATDSDLFQLKLVNGWLLAGELVPQVTVDDVRQAGQLYWKRIIKPAVRKQKNKAKRTAKKAVTDAAKKAAADPAAALLKAAWEAQAGGWDDVEITPCPAGCDHGFFQLDTTMHDSPRVTCSFCHGTGEDPSA